MAGRNRDYAATVLKLLIASFAVGILLSWFGFNYVDLLKNFSGTIYGIFQTGVGLIQKAIPYILLGGIIVLPIWLVRYLWKLAQSRRR